jgi:hypothetical protein
MLDSSITVRLKDGDPSRMAVVVSATSPDQRLRCSEIGRCKTLGEPIIDRREEPMGFLGSALVVPQP